MTVRLGPSGAEGLPPRRPQQRRAFSGHRKRNGPPRQWRPIL